MYSIISIMQMLITFRYCGSVSRDINHTDEFRSCKLNHAVQRGDSSCNLHEYISEQASCVGDRKCCAGDEPTSLEAASCSHNIRLPTAMV